MKTQRWIGKTQFCIGIGLLVVGTLVCLPGLGSAWLFDWDEANFAEAAREMVVLKDYLRVHIGYLPFYEKPPLFFWLQAASFTVFGVSEFAARLPNAVACGLTLFVLFQVGSRVASMRVGGLWVLLYMGSFLPHFYFRSGLIDPWFNLLIFSALLLLLEGYWRRSGWLTSAYASPWKWLVLGGAVLGLAILTKGPVALLLVGLTLVVYWVLVRFKWYLKPVHLIVFGLTSLAVAGLWFGAEIVANGPAFTREFFVYQLRLLSEQDAGHAGFPGYHVVVLLVGVFPASVFALPRLLRRFRTEARVRTDFQRWMQVLFWVVLGVFTLVQTKIVHYSSLAYFPLTYLAADALDRLWAGQQRLTTWQWALIIVLGFVAAGVFIGVPYLGNHPTVLLSLLEEGSFAWLAARETLVAWPWYTYLPGVLLALAGGHGWFWWLRGKRPYATLGMMLGFAFSIGAASAWFLPRLLPYSQGGAMAVLESVSGETPYVTTVGFKSYLPFFYTRPQPPQDSTYYLQGDFLEVRHWLRWQAPHPDSTYFLAKAPLNQDLLADPYMKLIQDTAGYGLFRQLARPAAQE